MALSYLITGTDTEIGKTVVTVAVMASFKQAGFKACGMKPVSSGRENPGPEPESNDAMLIKAHSSVDLPGPIINPLALKHPCAPNIAAEMEGKQIDLTLIIDAYSQITRNCDVVLVEGVGGWRCPVFSQFGMAEIAKSLDIPVILVVGIKLGCINHALLSVESILRDNVVLAGWVANNVDEDFQYSEATIGYLRGLIKAPLLGVVPFQDRLDYERLHKYISVDQLISNVVK